MKRTPTTPIDQLEDSYPDTLESAIGTDGAESDPFILPSFPSDGGSLTEPINVGMKGRLYNSNTLNAEIKSLAEAWMLSHKRDLTFSLESAPEGIYVYLKDEDTVFVELQDSDDGMVRVVHAVRQNP